MNTAFQNRLLGLSRQILQEHFLGQLPSHEAVWKSVAEAKRTCGVFVTLKIKGHLRGCMGMITSSQPIWETVVRLTEEAAFEDPRFSPLKAEELRDARMRISLLSPPAVVKSWKSIKLGLDGIILTQKGRRGLFLPEVASEQGWDLSTTLWHLCRKAGLPPDAWKESDCVFETFRTESFEEEVP